MHRNAIKQGLEIGVQSSGFRVPGTDSEFRFRVQIQSSDSKFRVQPLGCLQAKGCNPEPQTMNPEP